MKQLLTNMPPANRENLDELECRQIWCSPGVCDVKVNLPSEPYWRDRITCRTHTTHTHTHTHTHTQVNQDKTMSWWYILLVLVESCCSPCHLDLWPPQTSPDPEWQGGILLSVYHTAESGSFLQRKQQIRVISFICKFANQLWRCGTKMPLF